MSKFDGYKYDEEKIKLREQREALFSQIMKYFASIGQDKIARDDLRGYFEDIYKGSLTKTKFENYFDYENRNNRDRIKVGEYDLSEGVVYGRYNFEGVFVPNGKSNAEKNQERLDSTTVYKIEYNYKNRKEYHVLNLDPSMDSVKSVFSHPSRAVATRKAVELSSKGFIDG